MLETAHNTVKRVASQLGLNQADVEQLLKTNAEHEFEIALKNGKTFKGYRVQHNNKLGPYKGGIRFHPNVSLEEVRALATLMSLKTAAVGLPYGGGKGGVSVNPRDLTDEELEELSRGFATALTPHIGPDKDIPAPDVNTDSRVIDWMADEHAKITGDSSKASFTGKSVSNGGSLGRDAATGRGGAIVLREVLKSLDKTGPLTIAMQGAGNVGLFFVRTLEQMLPNFKLVGLTDSQGGVYDTNGLNASELASFKEAGNSLKDFKTGKVITNDKLLELNVDVLVLAALEDVITDANKDKIKASIVLELANGPVSEKAYDYLAANGRIIVPDIIANAGGVVVSYLEWVQNKSGEHWTEERVNKELENYLVRAAQNMTDYANKNGASLKDAAIAIAIKKLIHAPRS